jgi:hypothetical protein
MLLLLLAEVNAARSKRDSLITHSSGSNAVVFQRWLTSRRIADTLRQSASMNVYSRLEQTIYLYFDFSVLHILSFLRVVV